MQKGRGAPSNAASQRFQLLQRQDDGDWLDSLLTDAEPLAKLRTHVTEEKPRTILSFNRSPDLPFDRSVNAYRGCEHGCIYCYARPTHAYLNLSPGQDFETQLYAKPGAAALLRATLARPGYQPAPIAMGTNTDPYQPIERGYRITRSLLELMRETRHPVAITTKSAQICRDVDILAELAALKLTAVAISVTSLDADLARKLEPRASSPAKRLDAIARLADAGIPVHVNVSPIIPAITDHEIESIVDAAYRSGARSISWIALRLPHEVAPLFREWLAAHFPDRAQKVMAIQRDMRGGRDNDPRFAMRMRGQGVWAELIASRMRRLIGKYDLDSSKYRLRSDLFVRPAMPGDQLALL